jgi:hypothetical protein
MMPTASAVVADIIDVALGNSRTTFEHLRLKPRSETAPLIEKIGVVSRFYIRVMARISRVSWVIAARSSAITRSASPAPASAEDRSGQHRPDCHYDIRPGRRTRRP